MNGHVGHDDEDDDDVRGKRRFNPGKWRDSLLSITDLAP